MVQLMVRLLESITGRARNRRLLWTCLLVVVIIGAQAACRSALTLKSGPQSGPISAGANAIGEQCTVVPAPADSKAVEAQTMYKVLCGQWEAPSARIYLAKSGGNAMDMASKSWWRDRLDSFANCGAPIETGILDGVQALALDCTLRIGGWPYQALAVEIGKEVYLVEGVPASYPAAERALGVVSGRLTQHRATEQGKESNEIKRLEAKLAGANYSVGDLNAYQDLLRLAQYYNFQGNFSEAEQRYLKALQIQQKVIPGASPEQCFLNMSIGLELSNQGRFNAAEAMFDRAQSVVQNSSEPTDEARLVSYRAIHLANQRRNKEALELASKATTMRRELARMYGYGKPEADVPVVEVLKGEATRPTQEKDTLLSPRAATALGDIVQCRYVEAAMLTELGRMKEAEQALDEAGSIMEQEPRVPGRWLPQILLLRARIAELGGNWERAERLLQTGIEVQRSLFSESRTEGLANIALGRVYAGQGRWAQALESFRTGFAVVGKAGAGIRLDEAISFFRTGLAEAGRNPGKRQEIFSEMFTVGQLVRGSTVSQTMALTAARQAAGEHEVGSAIRELQDARHNRDKLRQDLTLMQGDPQAPAAQKADLEMRLQVLNSSIEDLERQVQAAAPRYNQLVDAPVSNKEVLSSLRPGEALAQILIGSKSSFGFFVDADGITPYEIQISERQASEAVRKLRFLVDAGGRLTKFPVADAYALYRRLLGPVGNRVAAAKHIIVVPSGPLLSLPFGILAAEPPTAWTGGSDYSAVPWMALRHPLTLAPSVQSFVNLRSTVQPSQAASNFIGFGDFVPSHDPQAILASLPMPETCRKEANLLANLPALPNTARELRGVAGVLGVDENYLVLGPSFCESTVRKSNLEKYRIVYFATHGLLPHNLKCLPEPALVLSMPHQEAERADGLLTGSKIADLKLDADLVVLSACNTGGAGGETGGEALSGLARSFFYAGARSLVVTHWEIPDKPTVKLLTQCFESLASRRLTLAEALQDGQASLIKNPATSHPLAWGAFTVVGDGGQTLQLQTGSSKTANASPF